MDLAAPQHVGSSWTMDQSGVLYIARWTLNHWTTWEALSSVQFSCVQLFVTLWTAAHQASLSFTNAQSLLKLMSIKLVMLSNHLILCHPLLLPSIFPSIRVFSSESVLLSVGQGSPKQHIYK